VAVQKIALRAGLTGVNESRTESLSNAGGFHHAIEAFGYRRGRGYSVKTIRELSVAGPCITLGLVLRETDRRISYRDRHGTPKFISKRWAVHTDPCPSCPDYLEDEIPG
jgi:hypothetical protein